METTVEADNKPKGDGDEVGADKASRSPLGEIKVKSVSREPDEAAEVKVYVL